MKNVFCLFLVLLTLIHVSENGLFRCSLTVVMMYDLIYIVFWVKWPFRLNQVVQVAELVAAAAPAKMEM